MSDPQTLELAASIGAAIPDNAPFDLVLAALELTIARRIKLAAGANPHPAWADMAAQLVARHIHAMLEFKGLIDG